MFVHRYANATGKIPMQMEKLGYSIDEFCTLHSICRGTLYNFWKAGVGPRWMQMQAGGRRLISAEAAAEWRREREAAVAQQQPRARVVLT
jgi:hypothetical protein